MSIPLYPRLNATVLAENGSTIPVDGISVPSMTNYYLRLLARGDVLTWDPRPDPGGVPTQMPSPANGVPIYATVAELRAAVGSAVGSPAITMGCLSRGDDGGGQWYWDATDNATTDNTGTCVGGGNGRWKRSHDGRLFLKWFGAVGDGVADDSTAWARWLAAVCTTTKHGVVSAGTYRINRVYTSDNITADNVVIEGVAGNLVVYKENIHGNENYNAFQATGRSNITITGVNSKSVTLCYFSTCSNVKIENCTGDGLETSASHVGWHWNKAVQFVACNSLTISGCKFTDYEFSVLLGGDAGTSTTCHQTAVIGCHFANSAINARTTADFPVGVYSYFSDDLTVSGCTFKNLQSQTIGGDTGSGCGFGYYEGDGTAGAVVIDSNTFIHEGAGDDRRMDGVYMSRASHAVVTNNTFSYTNNAKGIHVNYSGLTNTRDQYVLIADNICDRQDPLDVHGYFNTTISAVSGVGAPASSKLTFEITNNICNGGGISVGCADNRPFSLRVTNNRISNAQRYGIEVGGDATGAFAMVSPEISGNTISKAKLSGIWVGSTVVRAKIENNTVISCNTGNSANPNHYAGIVLPMCYGSTLKGNRVEQHPGSGGYMVRAIHGFQDQKLFAHKYDLSNSCSGINTPPMYEYFYTTAPVGGFDWAPGEVAYHSQPAAATAMGWMCVIRKEATLGANFTAGQTTVQLSSTSGMVAGDTFQIVKDATTLDNNTQTSYFHYYGVILSVDSGVQITLTAALPAGYSFSTATSKVVTLRWKAMAALAP